MAPRGRGRGGATSASRHHAAMSQDHAAARPIGPAAVGRMNFTACLIQRTAVRHHPHYRHHRRHCHCYRPVSTTHRHLPCRPHRPRPSTLVRRLDCPAARTACAAASSSTTALQVSTAGPSPYGTSPHGTILAGHSSSRQACAARSVTIGSFAAHATRSCSTARQRYRRRGMRCLEVASVWALTSILHVTAWKDRRRRRHHGGHLEARAAARHRRPARLRRLDCPCAAPDAVWSFTRARRGPTARRCPFGISRRGLTLEAHLSRHPRAVGPYATTGSREAQATLASWRMTIPRIQSQG